jgi:hypothetical protein
MTAAPSPIVHPEDFYVTARFSGGAMIHCRQDRIGAGLNSQPRCQATTSFATQCVADGEQSIAIAAGLSTTECRHHWQPLGKDPAATISRPTIETMRPQTDPNRRAVAREVTQGAAITTVYVTTASSTTRTNRIISTGGDDHHPRSAAHRNCRQAGQVLAP